MRRAAGAIRRIAALGDDALEAKGADMPEHRGTVVIEMLGEPQAMLGFA